MKPYTMTLKPLVLMMLFGILTISGLKAQEVKLEIQAIVSPASSPEAEDASILVQVLDKNEPYLFRLLDKAPWEGGVVIATMGPIGETEYRFTGLKAGNYMVFVTDNNQTTSFINVSVGIE